MDIPIAAIDKIINSMRRPIQSYVAQINQLAGDNVVGLTFFGPIAAGDFDCRHHAARNVLVLQHVDIEMLHSLAKRGVQIGKANIAAPLIMTPAYIQSSLDSFPLEFIEIEQCHINLFGEDFFVELPFKEEHIRLQCERELKGILIGMRQGLLAAAGRGKLFDRLETDSAQRLVRTLRGMLWLKGSKEGCSGTEVVTQMEKLTERSCIGIQNAVNRSASHDWNSFKTLYADVEFLGKMIDGW